MEVYGGVHFLSKLVCKRVRGWTLKTCPGSDIIVYVIISQYLDRKLTSRDQDIHCSIQV